MALALLERQSLILLRAPYFGLHFDLKHKQDLGFRCTELQRKTEPATNSEKNFAHAHTVHSF